MRGFAGSALSVVALVGCAQPPSQELDMTAERVETARAADAALFAAEPLDKADAALQNSRRLAKEGKYLPAIHAAGQAVAHADDAVAQATTERRIVLQKVERCLMELAGLLSIAESRGAAGEELAGHQAHYHAIKNKAESGDLLTALAEAATFKPELLAFEQRFRD